MVASYSPGRSVTQLDSSSLTETEQHSTNNAAHVVDQTAWPDFNTAATARRVAKLGGTPTRLTATGTVNAVAGTLLGFYVAATSSGTIVLRDGGASGTQVSGTITPAAGWHEYPGKFGTDCHATIGGSSLDVTFFFIPN